MPKRKQGHEEEDEGDSGPETGRIQVDFDFFDPNPEVDFVALKRLIIQLFQADADLLKPHELSELILSQPLVGTTVKTDGRESDPSTPPGQPAIKAITEYILAKSADDPSLHNALQTILGHDAPSHLGFIFSERLVNMPVEVIPDMYRMLADEIQWACDEGEPYHFSHLLVLSRTYTLPDEEVEATSTSPQHQKRRKGASTPSAMERVFPFHHEDICIQQVASHSLDYSLSNTLPREKESFGLEQGGRLMLFEVQKLPGLVSNLAAAFPQPSP
ncbi:p21-C-terminal region-binding protein-domain-containing protein [Russula aff. rugulosa BPL654]|nr:p21-C-terminal region-binding protein-domain-containing protein [Russula aff. rugulosa BPL654]